MSDNRPIPWPWPATTAPINLNNIRGKPFRLVAWGHKKTEDFVAGRTTFYLDENGLLQGVEIEGPSDKPLE